MAQVDAELAGTRDALVSSLRAREAVAAHAVELSAALARLRDARASAGLPAADGTAGAPAGATNGAPGSIGVAGTRVVALSHECCR